MPGFFRRRSNNEFNGDDSDPLTNVMLPSIYETQEEREARIAIQLEEKKRSDAIDEEINRQRLENKKAPRCVRVLLLGVFLQLYLMVHLMTFNLIVKVKVNQVFYPTRPCFNCLCSLCSLREIHYTEE